MKTILISAMMLSLAMLSFLAKAQVEHEKFGKISFATENVWKVGQQTWSDAVTATKCQKTDYNCDIADCRSNPDYKGDLFSWYAVSQYKDVLCPNGWRVPTSDDFIKLDKTFGGNGISCRKDDNEDCHILLNKYLNSWGGVYGGYCPLSGVVDGQGLVAYYWSQEEYDLDDFAFAHNLLLDTNGYALPQDLEWKRFGFSLRCVK